MRRFSLVIAAVLLFVVQAEAGPFARLKARRAASACSTPAATAVADCSTAPTLAAPTTPPPFITVNGLTYQLVPVKK